MASYFHPTQDTLILTDASRKAAILAPAAGGPATVLSQGAAQLVIDAWFGPKAPSLDEALASQKADASTGTKVTSWLQGDVGASFATSPAARSAVTSVEVAAGQDLPINSGKVVKAAGDGVLSSRQINGFNVYLHESATDLPPGAVPDLDGVVAVGVSKDILPEMRVMQMAMGSSCGACGACGVCGGCALCAAVNFSAAAAAATAVAALTALAAAVNAEVGIA